MTDVRLKEIIRIAIEIWKSIEELEGVGVLPPEEVMETLNITEEEYEEIYNNQ